MQVSDNFKKRAKIKSVELEYLSKEKIFKIIRQHRRELKRYGVKRIGLFGSFVRGENKKESDIDIIVEFEKGRKNFDNFMNTVFLLEKLFGRDVDILTPESINKHLKSYIMKEAIYEEI
ncbi:MAG TPA: nucleotidyltransferase [Candidatus Atribacteria bacterium]|nr:nucleotidyltransferase [Candidatus Atribacteria bacterium]